MAPRIPIIRPSPARLTFIGDSIPAVNQTGNFNRLGEFGQTTGAGLSRGDLTNALGRRPSTDALSRQMTGGLSGGIQRGEDFDLELLEEGMDELLGSDLFDDILAPFNKPAGGSPNAIVGDVGMRGDDLFMEMESVRELLSSRLLALKSELQGIAQSPGLKEKAFKARVKKVDEKLTRGADDIINASKRDMTTYLSNVREDLSDELLKMVDEGRLDMDDVGDLVDIGADEVAEMLPERIMSRRQVMNVQAGGGQLIQDLMQRPGGTAGGDVMDLLEGGL